MNTTNEFVAKLNRFETAAGFIAALDQSGGSTPKALRMYGIDDSAYSTDGEMFDLIQQARARIIESPVFTSDRVLAAILFEGTLDRTIDGQGVADYLWSRKQILPILKIDKGLAEKADGVQRMKDIPGLDQTLARAREQGVFGTKERSFIAAADEHGIADVVAQQFAVGDQVLAAGLVPILEPEIDIHAPDKADAETILKAELLKGLGALGDQKVAVKITLPSVVDFYLDLVKHPNVARVVALSGGYSRDEANAILARNHGVIASFSRALLDGLTADQTDAEFDATLDASIRTIAQASAT
ncbi:MAG: fructose bisphosphate aldolase [Gordonia sp. (in: high G+C Gram-positive bacteria)]|uniref:fructose bisphosphate aldolase n=1 Tax=Gordonia sp. (in: high G+C Gram-positive bacteria) TaxID=84139 RepID=UPI0039E343CF